MDLNNTKVITFAGSPAHKELQKEFEDLYASKFSSYQSYDIDWLKESGWFNAFPNLFCYEKYCGYFLWKPIIISDSFSRKPVLYFDSNVRFTDFNKFFDVYSSYTESVFFSKYNHYFNRDWTKRDAFILMELDLERYWNSPQTWTVFMGFDGSLESELFFTEYFKYCQDPRIVTEEPNVMGKENLPGYIAHRWEQSVFSLLVEKYKFNGILYNDLFEKIYKIYPRSVLELKQKIDKNPLGKVNNV